MSATAARSSREVAYEQMQELPYYNNFFQTTHPPAVDLAEVLSQVTPEHLNHVFFTNSGSEANDTVVRMVRRYWDVQGKPERTVIISRENAYHGSTMAGASLGGMKPMHRQGGMPIPDIEHITQPYWYALGGDLSPEEFGLRAARALEERIKGARRGPRRRLHRRADPRRRRRHRAAGELLAGDRAHLREVRHPAGGGRGHLRLRTHGQVVRQRVSSASSRISCPSPRGCPRATCPSAASWSATRVADVLINRGGEFQHGFTYSGHPACCAVAAANIRILRDERIIERAEADTAPYLQKRIREFESHPSGRRGARRRHARRPAVRQGQENAHTLFDPPGNVGSLCRDHCTDNDVILRAVGDSMILSPPLIISQAEIDELMEKAGKALDLTARDLGIS